MGYPISKIVTFALSVTSSVHVVKGSLKHLFDIVSMIRQHSCEIIHTINKAKQPVLRYYGLISVTILITTAVPQLKQLRSAH